MLRRIVMVFGALALATAGFVGAGMASRLACPPGTVCRDHADDHDDYRKNDR